MTKNKKIEYLYLDVDNRKFVKSYDELKKIYFLGVQDVYEMVYPCYISGQCLMAMSNKQDYSECALRLMIWQMWQKLHPDNTLEKWYEECKKHKTSSTSELCKSRKLDNI